MEKSNFYNVFKHISHSKCKTVYTFRTFFGLPSSRGVLEESMAALEPWIVIQFGPPEKNWIRESNRPEKDQENYALEFFLQSDELTCASEPYILTRASLQDDGSC